MFTYVQGGFFASPAQTLVNTVNTVGVMGKGLAKEFKAVWPEMYEAYAERCAAGEIVPGALHLWRSPHKWVLNFPTKRHWRQRSRIEDVDAGLRTFAATWADHGITSVAFPQLGCGNGGLDWEGQVRPLMERWLAPLPIDVFVHVADGGPLLPDGPEGEAMVAWLRGEPTPPSFDRFWDAIVGAVEAGAPGWRLDGGAASHAPDGAGSVPVVREDWHRLWQELTAGFLDADAAALIGAPSAAVGDLLERTSVVAPVRAARIRIPDAADGVSVTRLLAEPAARAFRYDPIADDASTGLGPATDGVDSWTASPTTRQLPMSLTA